MKLNMKTGFSEMSPSIRALIAASSYSPAKDLTSAFLPSLKKSKRFTWVVDAFLVGILEKFGFKNASEEAARSRKMDNAPANAA